jgi:lipopolysaccharide transport system permease protein
MPDEPGPGDNRATTAGNRVAPAVSQAWRVVATHRGMLLSSALVELRSRYAGSVLGLAWAIATPLVLVALYSAVYLVIFRVRVPGLTSFGYLLYVLAGLLPYVMTAEAMASAAVSISGNRQLLLNTVYPIELAPVRVLLVSQPPVLVGMLLVVAGVTVHGLATPWLFLLPLLWVLHLATLLGVVWVIALVNLVVRDIQHGIGYVLMALLIASPFAYTPEMVPEQLRILIWANPLAHFVICYQHATVLGTAPPLASVLVVVLLAVLSLLGGSHFFTKMKASLLDHV